MRAIARRLGGVVMDFHKNSVHTARNSRACKIFDVLRLSARCLAQPARKLQRMRDIEYDRNTKGTHYRKRAEIDNQIIVPEARAAFRKQYFLTARIPQFF